MEYCDKFTLRISDRTSNGRLRFSTLMSLMQEVADGHSALYGLNNASLLSRGYAWVLTRMAVKLYDESAAKDVNISTYALPGRTIEFPREYVVYSGKDRIAYGLSYWSVISMENRKLVRTGDIKGYCEMSKDKLPDICYDKVRLSMSNEYIKTGEHTVLNTEIDMLGHMNNIYYADIVENSLDKNELLTLNEINISFIHEAKLGEVIEIFKLKHDSGVYVVGLLKDEMCFAASLT